jgi:catechol 2,3-dioxygenase
LLPKEAGGGYGFRFKTPDGLPLCISCDVTRHDNIVVDRSKPTKVSHVVLNSAATDEQVPFFIDALGFKLSDSSHMMEFLRCSSDHHAIAVFRNKGPSLNHVAFEMPNIDGLMLGVGRLKSNGIDPEWGIGRHGPGNNVFSYFVEPNGFVTEYTTEVDQVDDTHVPHDAAWWKAFNYFPCRWGMAGYPTELMEAGWSGKLVEQENQRCEQVMARKLGR